MIRHAPVIFVPARSSSETGHSEESAAHPLAHTHASNLPGPWRDGFEALATMDRNEDGEISGKELSDLGLWFDRNRDGVSQNGEVIPIEKTDVRALYYQADYRDEARKEIYALRGYERATAKGVATGALVDWYGEEYSSEQEGVLLSLGRSALSCDKDLGADRPALAPTRRAGE